LLVQIKYTLELYHPYLILGPRINKWHNLYYMNISTNQPDFKIMKIKSLLLKHWVYMYPLVISIYIPLSFGNNIASDVVPFLFFGI